MQGMFQHLPDSPNKPTFKIPLFCQRCQNPLEYLSGETVFLNTTVERRHG